MQITAVRIPCPHCGTIRVCRHGDGHWIGDAVCDGCGAFVPGQDWRETAITAMVESALHRPLKEGSGGS